MKRLPLLLLLSALIICVLPAVAQSSMTPLAQATAFPRGPYLNLRAAPTTDSPSLTRIAPGTVLSIIGRDSNAFWLQTEYLGRVGWVAGWLTTGQVGVINVPCTAPDCFAPPSVPTVTVQYALGQKLRSLPYLFGSDGWIATVPRGAAYPILARTADSAWVKVNAGGYIGWLSLVCTGCATAVDLHLVPVEGQVGTFAVPFTGLEKSSEAVSQL